MLRTLACIAASIVGMSMAAPAFADTLVFAGPLNPAGAGSTGAGYAQAIFDTDAQTLAITTRWSGLSGTTTAAHIHCCVDDPDTGGAAVNPVNFPGFPVGVSSGSYSTVLDLSQAGTYTAAFRTKFGRGTVEGSRAALVAGLQSKEAYLNIHSSNFPGGEIRGFLFPWIRTFPSQ